MISTKGRYSVRILLDLAEHHNGGYIPMKEVAARQDISLKYIERLMPALKSAGLIDSVHGAGGGYRLTRPPEDYPVGEILRAAEGSLAPIACQSEEGAGCGCGCDCDARPFWKGLEEQINSYVDGHTLAQCMRVNEKTPAVSAARNEDKVVQYE